MGTGAKVAIGVAIAVGVALVGTVLVWALNLEANYSASGCGSIDPTDPLNYSNVTIVNDSNASVVLKDCLGGGCRENYPVLLRPHRSFSDIAECGQKGADMTAWTVTSTTGVVQGYVVVNSPKSQPGLTYNISQVSPNRLTPTPEAPKPKSALRRLAELTDSG